MFHAIAVSVWAVEIENWLKNPDLPQREPESWESELEESLPMSLEDLQTLLNDHMKLKLGWSWALAILAVLLELLALIPIVISQRREDGDKNAFNMTSK